MTSGQKIETVKRKGLCLNCLGQGHKSSNCPSSRGCFHCKRKHHTLLHEQSDIGNSSSTTDNSNPTTSTTNTQVNVHQAKPVSEAGAWSVNSLHIPTIVVSGQVLLATAVVTLLAPDGHQMTAHALLDQGSEACYVTEMVAQRLLRLPHQRSTSTIVGIGKCEAGNSNGVVNVTLQSRNGDIEYPFSAHVMRTLTEILSTRTICRGLWDHLDQLTLADPNYFKPGKIDILPTWSRRLRADSAIWTYKRPKRYNLFGLDTLWRNSE